MSRTLWDSFCQIFLKKAKTIFYISAAELLYFSKVDAVPLYVISKNRGANFVVLCYIGNYRSPSEQNTFLQELYNIHVAFDYCWLEFHV